MKTFQKFTKIGFWFMMGFIALQFQACNNTSSIIDEAFNRLFHPTTFTVTNIQSTSFVLQWNQMPGVDHYVIELSQDSLLFNPVDSTFTVSGTATSANSYTSGTTVMFTDTITNLHAGIRYSVRLQGISATTGVGNSHYVSATFVTPTEQLLEQVGSGDKTNTTAIIRWPTGTTATQLVYYPQADPQNIQTINLTSTQLAAGTVKLTGLTGNTVYVVQLMNGIYIRGNITFATYPDVPSAQRVIFLQATDSIHNVLDTCTAQTITLVLPAGSSYAEPSTLNIPNNASVTFYGMPGATLPQLLLVKVQLPSVAGTIQFQNLELMGYNSDGGSNYVINQGTATNTDAIIFENCWIHHFRSPSRIQSSNSILVSQLKYDNCITYDNGYGGYQLVTTSNASAGKFDNIIITNTTVIGIDGTDVGLILCNLVPPTSIDVENCTFYDMVKASKYFIDLNTNSTDGTIKNCIFGKSNSQLTTSGAKGIRTGSSGSMLIMNSYATSDWITTANNITDLIQYSGTSTDLFKDPTNNNFTIIDQNFTGANTAGDPRWRP
ncbi:DUF5123 domain-containing protein [Microbacter margulisiae]|uniref:Fibronectin type-III domain-containing protein n=1 Tax=Microbacter margulisiae TaxID=1350067 RepID=A0A7W5DRW6_9PORP|nr:DUF5123 domain-containing protein [Microbacter margulisiae]MBB3187962.1 hypothetical protein [Microbacter margulisiae]